MPKTTQQQFTDLLQKAADDYERDLVVDLEWANVGTASFLRRGTLEVLFDFHFDFQKGEVTFERLPYSVAQAMAGRTTERDHMRYAELPAAVARVRDALALARQDDLDLEELERPEG